MPNTWSTSAWQLVIAGISDPQMSQSEEALTARKIGAPQAVFVPGRHLTMVASLDQVAGAIDAVGH